MLTITSYTNHQLKIEICKLRYDERYHFNSPEQSNKLESMEREWQRRYNTGKMGGL